MFGELCVINIYHSKHLEKMESGLTMLFHAFVIGILLYVVMVFALKQSSAMAIDRSILIAALLLAYMILFGHGLPTKVNKNIL